MDMGREAVESSANGEEEKLLSFGMKLVEYDMVTLHEGLHARMEEAEPAMEDGVLCRKEEWLLIVEYDMLTLDEGELARMEVVNPATEDAPLPFKEYVIR